MAVLECDGVSIRFGGVQALDEVSLSVGEWEVVGLIGPNGAGKTTLFNCITGFYQPNSGRVLHMDEDITELPTHRRAARGIARTFQHVGLVRSMTVIENVVLAQHMSVGYPPLLGMIGAPSSFLEEGELRRRGMEILDFMGLAGLANSKLQGLPYGTLKTIEVASVLATDPELLLLDEPAAGMGPEESFEFGDRLREMRKELGITIVLIDHHVPLVVRVCDYVYCLNFGRMLAEGLPEEVRSHPEVIAAYLGEDADGAA